MNESIPKQAGLTADAQENIMSHSNSKLWLRLATIFLSFFVGQVMASDMAATRHLESIVVGAGCFWGVEKRFEAIDGVVDATSGYADGRGLTPTYSNISSPENKENPDNYAEVVKITFNPRVVSLEALLKKYFEMHDPTQLNRQGNDYGTQYRSTILYSDSSQEALAQRVRGTYQTLLSKAGMGRITTAIKPLDTFYPAERYHQDYLTKNPGGYCPDHSTGIKFDAASDKTTKLVDNKPLTDGKQIVVIIAEDYCPYCEKFRKDVLNSYRGDIPVTLRFANQLQGLRLKTPTWATPTILFLNDGREVYGRQGYLTSGQFYEALGRFKLGGSEAFDVAFQQNTDAQFCRQYDIFKNTPDGVFVDKLSGRPLFDTKDRFNSKSGWLSFTKPVAGAVTEHPDNSHGMQRTEIRATVSGIHLGHVFDDGPNGQRRYCINATVLDFVPRK